MTARTTRAPAAPAEPASWNFLADLGRQQWSVAADASSAWLRGLEAMRKIQEKAAQDASERHGAAAHRLQGSCEPADVIAMQAGLLRDDLESATQYWQQLAATAMEMQTEMMSCASHLVDSDAALETASAMQDALALMPGARGFLPQMASPPARRTRKD